MSRSCDVHFKQLIDFSAGELSQEKANELQAHLKQGCKRCERELGWLRKVAATVHSPVSDRSSSWMIQQTVKVLSPHYARTDGRSPLLTRMLVEQVSARLVSDSYVSPSVVGIRGGVSPTRQVLYSAESLDVDLRVETESSGMALIGQVLPTGGVLDGVAEAEVWLERRDGTAEEPTRSKPANAYGEFSFTGLPAGQYDLRVRTRDREVTLQGLQL